MTNSTAQARSHLWEYDHPSYGADGYTVECASFAELREHVDASDKDLNRIYRRDWFDHTQHYADDLHLDGEDRSTQTFISWSCPISHDQEAEVLAWLRRPAGARRAPDAVGPAPRRNEGSAVSAADPYAAVIPRRYSVAGHVATPPRGLGLAARGRHAAAPGVGGGRRCRLNGTSFSTT